MTLDHHPGAPTPIASVKGGVTLADPATMKKAERAEENNAFDLVRLLLALLVVYTHAYLVGGFGVEGFQLFAHNQTIAGTFAVLGFFGISGFLVTRSFVGRHDWRLFISARLLRILPGLYFSLFLTAFVFAPLVSYFNASSEGWHAADATGFLIKNLAVRVNQWNVGHVLTGLPYEGSLNGALWSLFPEMCCYGLVLVLGLAGSLGLRRSNLILFTSLLFILHAGAVVAPQVSFLVPTLLSLTGWTRYLVAFLVGASMYAFKGELGIGRSQAVFWWIAVAVLLKFGGWQLLAPVVLPIALIHGSYALRIKLRADLSYGIYVLHFPVLQILAASGFQNRGFMVYFLGSLAITLVVATISWFCIEHPALKLKGYLERMRKPPPDRSDEPARRLTI